MKNAYPQGKVFSYLRWSSDGQKLGDSERRQTEPALNWCKQHGRVLDDRDYTDRGVSGWHGAHRKHGRLGELLSIVKEGDVILVEDASRWSREPALDSMNALRDTVNKGVEIVFLKSGLVVNRDNFNRPEVFLSNALNTFMANAENEERARKIREAMEGKRQQIAQGKLPFGRLPAWLQWDAPPKTPRKIVVIEEKAALVRRIFKLCLEGKGVRAIERLLRGCPPMSNSKRAIWNSRFLHRLLSDKAVLGHYGPTDQAGIYPAIIDEGTFYAAGAALAGRRHWTVREAYADHNLFTGLVRCERCGNSLVRHSTHTHGYDYTYLLCSGRLRGLAPDCSASGLRYDFLEENLLAMLSNSDLVRAVLANEVVEPSNLDVLKGRLTSVQAAANALFAKIEGDEHPARRVMERLKVLEAQETALSEQVEAEAAKVKSQLPALTAYEEIRDLGERLKEPATRLRLRAALGSLIERITSELGQNQFTVHFVGGGKVAIERRRNGVEMTLIDHDKLPRLNSS